MLFGLFGKKNQEQTSGTWPATSVEEEEVQEVKAEPAPAAPVTPEPAPVTPEAPKVEETSTVEEPKADAADDIQDVIAPLPLAASAAPGSLQARFPYLDVEQGLSYCGMMEDFYLEMMGDFMEVDEPEQMETYFNNGNIDFANYRIHAHALKSTARTIGAIRMSERALGLEEAARDEKADYIIANHQKVLDANVILGKKLREDLDK